MIFRALNQTKNAVIAEHVNIASSFLDRLRGLLGRRKLELNEGLWITPCNSIHTFFMQFPIDVIFLSSTGSVLRVFHKLAPFRLTQIIRDAKGVLELPAGTLELTHVSVGDRIIFEPQERS